MRTMLLLTIMALTACKDSNGPPPQPPITAVTIATSVDTIYANGISGRCDVTWTITSPEPGPVGYQVQEKPDGRWVAYGEFTGSLQVAWTHEAADLSNIAPRWLTYPVGFAEEPASRTDSTRRVAC